MLFRSDSIVNELSALQEMVSASDKRINDLNLGISEVSVKESALSQRMLEIYRIDLNAMDTKIDEDRKSVV